ncbi:hypothetical protein PFISCL1PPCAC_22372, partial [Pristionchus fissidentatus]
SGKMASEGMEAPLQFLIPSLPRMFVFFLVLVSYVFVSGGVPYCTITGMPFMGTAVDDRGNQVPQAIMPRSNGQYLGEGIAVGFFLTMGGLGMVFLDRMNSMTNPSRMARLFLAAVGMACTLGSIFAIRAFIGKKDHWYFKASMY